MGPRVWRFFYLVLLDCSSPLHSWVGGGRERGGGREGGRREGGRERSDMVWVEGGREGGWENKENERMEEGRVRV